MRGLLLPIVALAMTAATLTACGGGSSPARTTGHPAGPGASTGSTVPSPTCTIPQNNGGDHDADNNGGPNDGDGCDV